MGRGTIAMSTNVFNCPPCPPSPAAKAPSPVIQPPNNTLVFILSISLAITFLVIGGLVFKFILYSSSSRELPPGPRRDLSDFMHRCVLHDSVSECTKAWELTHTE